MNGKRYKLRFLPLFEDDLNGMVPSRFMRKIVCRLRQT